MTAILGFFGKVPNVKRRSDVDLASRLACKTTVAMLVFFAIIVTSKQFVGEPIKCWAPAEFTGNQIEYTNNFCWIGGTYHLPLQRNFPEERLRSKQPLVSYYQWLFVVFSIQALICYMPIYFWKYYSSKSGINVSTIIDAGGNANKGNVEDREKVLQTMVKMTDRYICSQSEIPTSFTFSINHLFSRIFRCCKKNKGNYLSFLYIFFKFLTLVSIAGQVLALVFFIKEDAAEIIRSFFSDDRTAYSSRFPIVTMCDFKVRRLGNVQRHTVQCVLPINLFNEKIYVFLLLWLLFVGVVVLMSFAKWMFLFICGRSRRRFIMKHLCLMDKIKTPEDRVRVVKFVEEYLRLDGFFLIRMLESNTNTITATEFVSRLWENHKQKDQIENGSAVL